MCKFSSGCGSSDKIKCKNCGVDLCKQCSRSLKTDNPPSSGNSAQCGDCKKNFRWSLRLKDRRKEIKLMISLNLFLKIHSQMINKYKKSIMFEYQKRYYEIFKVFAYNKFIDCIR